MFSTVFATTLIAAGIIWRRVANDVLAIELAVKWISARKYAAAYGRFWLGEAGNDRSPSAREFGLTDGEARVVRMEIQAYLQWKQSLGRQ